MFLIPLAVANCARSHTVTPTHHASAGNPELNSFLRVATAELDTEGAAIVASGAVAFDEEHVAAIIPPVQGRVVRVIASAGDHVEQNAPLALVYSAEVAGAGAGVTEARIARVAAEQNLARAQRLADEGAGALRDVIDAQAALGNARAEEARASAAVRALGAGSSQAATYALRAPISGTVIQRALRVGAEARPDAAEPAFLIADLRHVWIVASLHEAQASPVHVGDHASVEVAAVPGRRFEAQVERVSDAVDPHSHHITVRLGLDNPGAVLKPEMFAQITIHSAHTNVVTLPTAALITQPNGYAVFVQGANGRFDRRAVTIGAEWNGHSQIISGIQAGERVVVEGALLLDPSAGQIL